MSVNWKSPQVRKKVFLSGGVGLVLTYFVVVPLILGYVFDQALITLQKELNGQAGQGVTVKIDNNRGLWSSKGDFSLDLKAKDKKGGKDLTIGVDGTTTFNHLLAKTSTLFKLAAGDENQMTSPEIRLDVGYSFFKGVHASFELPQFNIAPSKDRASSFEMKKTKGEIIFGYSFIPKVVKVNLPFFKIAEGLKKVEFQGLDFYARLKRDWGKIDGTVELSFDQMDNFENRIGPGIVELGVQNIDQKAWKEILPIVTDLMMGKAKDQNAKMGLVMKSMQVLPGLVKLSPILELRRLNLKTERGHFQGNAAIQFLSSENTSNDRGMGLGFSALSYLSNVQAKVNFSAPKESIVELYSQVLAFKDSFAGMGGDLTNFQQSVEGLKDNQNKMKSVAMEAINEYTEKNFLVIDKENILFNFILRDGRMKLNGKSFEFSL